MVAASKSPNAQPISGIPLCVFGLFLISLQDIIIKTFSDSYSVLQIVFVRGVVGVVPIFIIVCLTSGWRGLCPTRPKLLLCRGFLGFLSYLTYYMAMAALPLVDVVTILFSAPILVTAMSALLLKEPVGARRWLALFIGFIGVVLVVGPNGDFRHLATLLALLAAFAYAFAILLTRVIGAAEQPWTITLYAMFAFIIGSVIAAALVAVFGAFLPTDHPSLRFLLRPWVVPPLADSLLMAFLGLNAALAFYCLVKAYWTSPASVVAPFEYTYIIWAVLFGYVIWGEVPRATSLIGVALLITCGFYIFCRELQLKQVAAPARRKRQPPPAVPQGSGG